MPDAGGDDCWGTARSTGGPGRHMDIDARTFAERWVEDWNSHDLDRILAHYAEEVTITTPMIRLAAGGDTDTLRGKRALAAYWAAALERIPDLRFRLRDVAAGVDSLALYYDSVLGRRAIEVMHFDEAGRVCRVVAHYTQAKLGTEHEDATPAG